MESASDPSRKNFTIPRRTNPYPSSSKEAECMACPSKITFLPLDSELYQNSYKSVFMSRLSNSCSNKESVIIQECLEVENRALEQKFNSCRKQLEASDSSTEISYGFVVLDSNPRQAEIIAEHGLQTGNFVVGEVGDAEKGVYLLEHPDLVVPCPFLETTKLHIMCFKILKGKSRIVDLGSCKAEPTLEYNSHVPPPFKSRRLSRYVAYRFSQVFLYEALPSGQFAKVPSSVLPYAIFVVEFPASLKYNVKLTPIWKGSLKLGSTVFDNIRLCSTGGILLKPQSLAPELQIPALVDWTTCLEFPYIQELLVPALAGDLGVKKEVFLAAGKRFVSYFLMDVLGENAAFSKFVEIAQVQRVVGYQILDSDAYLLLVPNGSLSLTLSLPFKSKAVFHCLHISRESCVIGSHKPANEKESVPLGREPSRSERIDGLNHRVQKAAYRPRHGCNRGIAPGNVATNENLSISHAVDEEKRVALRKVVLNPKEDFESIDMDLDETSSKNTVERSKDHRQASLSVAQLSKPVEGKATIVKTSSCLSDPRLPVSDSSKKRRSNEDLSNPRGKTDDTNKRTKQDGKKECVSQRKKEEPASCQKSEVIPKASTSYAYQAPVPQVALVIEKMRDSEDDSKNDRFDMALALKTGAVNVKPEIISPKSDKSDVKTCKVIPEAGVTSQRGDTPSPELNVVSANVATVSRKSGSPSPAADISNRRGGVTSQKLDSSCKAVDPIGRKIHVPLQKSELPRTATDTTRLKDDISSRKGVTVSSEPGADGFKARIVTPKENLRLGSMEKSLQSHRVERSPVDIQQQLDRAERSDTHQLIWQSNKLHPCPIEPSSGVYEVPRKIVEGPRMRESKDDDVEYSGDIDLRVMPLSEVTLAKIMCSLQAKCESVAVPNIRIPVEPPSNIRSSRQMSSDSDFRSFTKTPTLDASGNFRTAANPDVMPLLNAQIFRGTNYERLNSNSSVQVPGPPISAKNFLPTARPEQLDQEDIDYRCKDQLASNSTSDRSGTFLRSFPVARETGELTKAAMGIFKSSLSDGKRQDSRLCAGNKHF